MTACIIVANRPAMLAATVSSLMHSTHPVELWLGLDGISLPYTVQQLLKVPGTKLKLARTKDTTGLSVAAARASLIQESKADDVLMLDGDFWCSCATIAHVVNTYNMLPDISVVGMSLVDVDDARGHGDTGFDLVDSPFSVLHKSGLSSFYRRYAKTTLGVDLVCTFGMWRVPHLIEDKVLDKWLAWPKGVRGYDTNAALLLRRAGRRLAMLSNVVGQEDTTCYHLYTAIDEKENVWTQNRWSDMT